MKYFLGCCLLFFTCINLSFGQTEGEDVILLKNDTKVRGIIIEQRPGQFIRLLQLPSLDTLQIKITEIESILKIVEMESEKPVKIDTLKITETNNISETLPIKDLDTVRFFHVRLSHSWIKRDYGGRSYGLSLHKNIKPNLNVGIGSNYFKTFLNVPYPERQSIVTFLAVDYNISLHSKNRVGFISGLNLGYNVDFSAPYFDIEVLQQVTISNGPFIHPYAGFRFNVFKNVGIRSDVGYQYIRTGVKQEITGQKLEARNLLSFVFRLSLFF